MSEAGDEEKSELSGKRQSMKKQYEENVKIIELGEINRRQWRTAWRGGGNNVASAAIISMAYQNNKRSLAHGASG